MIEFKAKDIAVGDEFTVDEGKTWWAAVKIEPAERNKILIKKMMIRGGPVFMEDEIFEPNELVIVR